MGLANESPLTSREQNAWQDGAFRFGLEQRCPLESVAALLTRVQRTHRREHRSTRRKREDIVAKILHKRLAK